MEVSRQGSYKFERREALQDQTEQYVLEEVSKIRLQLETLGTRKLLVMLQEKLASRGLKIGRDRMFDLLRKHGKLSRLSRRFRKTSNSKHSNEIYPFLLEDLPIVQANQVLVSDITYLLTQDGFCYLALITDAFSRRILGYHVSQRMKTALPLQALQNACASSKLPPGFIHHSDKGSQYCSKAYTGFLKSQGARISMTGNNRCYDNALAERVNGILKTEFGLGRIIRDFRTACKLVKNSIDLYNSMRPHQSLDYQTPDAVYFRNLHVSAA